MLYEIREVEGKFHLYLRRKRGFKFKKRFSEHEYAERFAQHYITFSCLTCKEGGSVYQVKRPYQRRNMPPGFKIIGSIVVCPECRAQFHVRGDHAKQVFFLVPVSGASS
jgi:hypothetical protein